MSDHPKPLPPRPGPWLRFGEVVIGRPRLVAGIVLILALAAGGLAGAFLRVRPGYVDLLDKRSPLQARYLDLVARFGNIESLYVVVEGREDPSTDRFIDRFAELVSAARDAKGRPFATNVLDKVDPEWFVERLPAWLPEPLLEHLGDDVAPGPGAQSTRFDLPSLVADPSPARLLSSIHAAVDAAAADAAAGHPGAVQPDDLVGLGSLFDGIGGAARGERFSIPNWLLRRAGQERRGLDELGHLELGPGRYLLTIAPADTSNNYQVMVPLLDAVKQAARQAREETGASVDVSYTGAPALIVDEMKAVSRDVTLASLLSVVLVTLLFFVSFNSLRHVLFAGIANIAGLALTFGAAWILVGYLNLFSAVFAAVLAGLGIDFGIHVINHYEANRREGQGWHASLLEVFRSSVPAIATSAVTTAAAFLAIMTSEFRGFSQLGLISGVGVILCVAMSITLVPALLAWDARRGREPLHPQPPWSERWLLGVTRRPLPFAIIGLCATLLAGGGLFRLRFDHDLMNLQPGGTEAVALEKQQEKRISTHQAFSIAPTLEEAIARSERLSRLPSVAQVTSAATFLPPPSLRRQELLQRLSQRLPSIPAAPTGPVDVGAALAEADALTARMQELQDLAFDGGDEKAVAALDAVLGPLAKMRADIASNPGAQAGLSVMRDDLARELRAIASRLPQIADHPIRPQDLPRAIGAHYVGNDGSLAIIVEPRDSVWDRAALERFVADVRGVDPDATGPPIQILEVTEMMRRSLERAALIALAVIVLLSIVSMRNIAGTALALLPLALGFVLMLGAMGWADVPLNPANLVALPLLLGIGVDAGVHVAHRWLEVRDAPRTVRDVGHPLLITSLTTVAGFLPLLFARHRGIRSLGVVTCLGSVTMLLAAVVLMPALLALLDTRRRRAAGPAS